MRSRAAHSCSLGLRPSSNWLEPLDTDSRLARDLRENGQLPHSLCFLVADLAAAAAHLKSIGVAVEDVSPTSLLLDPSATLGAVIELTDVQVPGDPR